jgi:hypothetical protein
MSNADWIAHAYPLQQLTVKLQGTRRSDKASIVAQLETVLARLKAGDTSGQNHDDDFGYFFEYIQAAPGPSFFDEPAGTDVADNKWVNREIQQATDDPRPNVSHEDVMAHMEEKIANVSSERPKLGSLLASIAREAGGLTNEEHALFESAHIKSTSAKSGAT